MVRSWKTVRPVVWVIAAGAVLVGLTIAAGLNPNSSRLAYLAPVVIFLATAGGCALLFLSIGLAANARQRRAAMILSYLEQAIRLNLPLPRILRAARHGETARSAWRLRLLQQQLEAGMPLGRALEASAPEVSARTIAMLSAAERIGQLPSALVRLRREQRRSPGRDTVNVMFYRFYPVMMLIACAVTLTLIGVFVLPKYEVIFSDFGQRLPAITTRTFMYAYAVAPWFLALLAVVLLSGAFRTVWRYSYPLHHREAIGRAFFDRLAWRMPILHALERDRGLADAFTFIADGVEAEVPLHIALGEASSLHINDVLHKRLVLWSYQTAQGVPLHEAARNASLPRLASGMLGNMAREEDAAGILRFLARYYRGRFSRLAAVIQAAIVPVMVLFFGLLVAVIVLSMFVPLTQLDRITAIKTGL